MKTCYTPMQFHCSYLDFEKLDSDVSRTLKQSSLASHLGLHSSFSFHGFSLIWPERACWVFFDFVDIFIFKEHRTCPVECAVSRSCLVFLYNPLNFIQSGRDFTSLTLCPQCMVSEAHKAWVLVMYLLLCLFILWIPCWKEVSEMAGPFMFQSLTHHQCSINLA